MVLGGGKIGPAFAKTKTSPLEANPMLILTTPESKLKKDA
jgi:hypothetical protein